LLDPIKNQLEEESSRTISSRNWEGAIFWLTSMP